MVNVGGTLFFAANDGTDGEELWMSDGTSGGTMLVKDINPGSSGSSLRYLTNVNGKLYFSANDGADGYELWKSDGTSGGTTLVANLATGASRLESVGAGQRGRRALLPPTTAHTDWSCGRATAQAAARCWSTTFKRPTGSNIDGLANFNGTLVFSADDGINGDQLWKSSGTTADALVADINGSSVSLQMPTHFTQVGNAVFFTADSPAYGDELWKTNGISAGTVLVKDINPGGRSSPRLFDERQRHVVLRRRRRHGWLRVVEERRHHQRHGARQRHHSRHAPARACAI